MKNVLVTGGSRGIGSGIVKAFAREGWKVFFTTHPDDRVYAEEVAKECEAVGACVRFTEAALDKTDAQEKAVREAIAFLGTIDVLVNNAGRTIYDNLLSMPEENMDFLYRLNFRSPVRMTQLTARHMIRHGIQGAIITIASTHGERAYVADGIYGGLKAALIRITETWALDLAPYRIRVNSIAPGAIQVRYDEKTTKKYDTIVSDGIPIGRQGFPEDIAQACLFLADSEKSGYITGTNIRVDGGLILPGTSSTPVSWKAEDRVKNWDDSEL